MISGLIYVARPADTEAIEHLADTLSALVAGVAAGLVADAVIEGRGLTEALSIVAEASGARLVEEPRGGERWRAGAEAARRDWVLCLEAGDLPRDGWIRVVDRFVNTARPEVSFGRLHRPHAGLSARIAAQTERILGVREPRAGDLVRRAHLLDPARMAARLRPRRLAARLDRV